MSAMGLVRADEPVEPDFHVPGWLALIAGMPLDLLRMSGSWEEVTGEHLSDAQIAWAAVSFLSAVALSAGTEAVMARNAALRLSYLEANEALGRVVPPGVSQRDVDD